MSRKKVIHFCKALCRYMQSNERKLLVVEYYRFNLSLAPPPSKLSSMHYIIFLMSLSLSTLLRMFFFLSGGESPFSSICCFVQGEISAVIITDDISTKMLQLSSFYRFVFTRSPIKLVIVNTIKFSILFVTTCNFCTTRIFYLYLLEAFYKLFIYMSCLLDIVNCLIWLRFVDGCVCATISIYHKCDICSWVLFEVFIVIHCSVITETDVKSSRLSTHTRYSIRTMRHSYRILSGLSKVSSHIPFYLRLYVAL